MSDEEDREDGEEPKAPKADGESPAQTAGTKRKAPARDPKKGAKRREYFTCAWINPVLMEHRTAG